MAIEAALTGHFVLSTLHTNDAPSALTRLNEMGVEPFLTGSAVTAVLAQRLARKLCTHCCEMYMATREEMLEARFSPEQAASADGVALYRKRGCPRCNQTGYKGRIGIYQLMVMNEDISRLAAQHASREELERAALETRHEDALGRRPLQGRLRADLARRAGPGARLALERVVRDDPGAADLGGDLRVHARQVAGVRAVEERVAVRRDQADGVVGGDRRRLVGAGVRLADVRAAVERVEVVADRVDQRPGALDGAGRVDALVARAAAVGRRGRVVASARCWRRRRRRRRSRSGRPAARGSCSARPVPSRGRPRTRSTRRPSGSGSSRRAGTTRSGSRRSCSRRRAGTIVYTDDVEL